MAVDVLRTPLAPPRNASDDGTVHRSSVLPLVTVLAGSAALLVLHAWWWWSHRKGMPRFIDEAGFLSFALDDTAAFRADGLGGLLETFRGQPLYGPLVPLATVPGQLVMGDDIAAGYVTVLGFLALLLTGTYLLARRLVAPWWAALAVLLVACTPQVVWLTRMYYFAVPAAALFTLGLWCLLRADGLTRPWWVVAGGLLLGLTALSRTMMVALVPAPFLAVAVQAVARKQLRHRQWFAFAAGVSVAVAVAAVWYSRSLDGVLEYLRRGGPDGLHEGRASVLEQLRQLVNVFLLPLATILLVALGVALIAWARERPRRIRLRALAAGDSGPLVIVLVWSMVVFFLASEAMGQWIAVLPTGIALAVAAMSRVQWRRARVGLATAVVAVALLALIMVSDVSPTLGRPRYVRAGPTGFVGVTEGRDPVERILNIDGVMTGRPGRLPDRLEAVEPFNAELTRWLSEYATERGQRPVVMFFGEGPDVLVGPWDLLLAARLAGDGSLLTGFLKYQEPLAARYATRLLDPAFGLPNLAVNFLPLGVPPTEAARLHAGAADGLVRAGFDQVRRVTLPDGRQAQIWWRSQT